MSLLDRMVLAVERVKDRLKRSAAALEAAGIPYAIAGGNAVAAWVASVDPAAVRNTQDVNILLRRADLDAAAGALESAGFIRRHVAGIDMFLDGPDAKARDAVHIIFANERIRAEYTTIAPDVRDASRLGDGMVLVLSLEALVRMKLQSNRDKDRTHLRDMLEVGLIDGSWVAKVPLDLAPRLQHILDTPET